MVPLIQRVCSSRRGRQSPAGGSTGRSFARTDSQLGRADVWKCMRGDGGSHFSSHAAFISTPPIPTDPRRAFALVGRFSALQHRHHHRHRHHRHPLSPKLVSLLSRLVAVVSSPLITRLLVKFVSGRGVSRGRSRNELARSNVLNKGSACTRLRTAFHFPFLVSPSRHLSPVPVAGLFIVVQPSPPMSAYKVARLVDKFPHLSSFVVPIIYGRSVSFAAQTATERCFSLSSVPPVGCELERQGSATNFQRRLYVTRINSSLRLIFMLAVDAPRYRRCEFLCSL